ncbi:MAG: hypothetical protein KGR25_07960 [Chloroflexi bacterium]|nr:hypothetical protein [Chloroflexota bacterium]
MRRRKPCRWWIGLVTVQPLITCGNHPVGLLILPIGKPITKVAWQSGLASPRLHRLDVVGHPLHRHHDTFRCGRTNVQLQARCPGITIARLADRSGFTTNRPPAKSNDVPLPLRIRSG